MTPQLWSDILFGNADHGKKLTNQAAARYAVGIVSYEDAHGRNASYEGPVWVSLHETEADALKAAEAKVHSWNGSAWVTHVVVNHGRKRIHSLDRPLSRFGDYVGPSRAELAKRMGV